MCKWGDTEPMELVIKCVLYARCCSAGNYPVDVPKEIR